jgi:anti-anti-sigma regulatory factor
VPPTDHQNSLSIEVFEQGPVLMVRLAGIINEDNHLQDHLNEVMNRKVVVNLSGVKRINSCGVRDWVRWIIQVESRENALYLTQVSPPLIGQINLVKNFCSNATVLSFQAPYRCPSCETESVQTLTTHSIEDGKPPPAAVCEACGEPLEFDALPGSYFAFVRTHASRAIPKEITGYGTRFDDAVLSTRVAALREITSSSQSLSSVTPTPGKKPSEGK